MKLFFTLFIIGLISINLSSQTTRHVPAQYATIQLGLNACQTGDTVLVQPGTYYENIFWPNVNGIKLFAEGDTTNTIIEGLPQGGSVITIISNVVSSNSIIKGFKIKGGNIAKGGGIYCKDAGPIFKELSITANIAVDEGGGIYFENSNALVEYCQIYNNSANNYGGGIYIQNVSKSLLIVNSLIHHNTAPNGGGISGYNFSFIKSTLKNNTALTIGGGAYIFGPAIIDSSLISNNSAGQGGGMVIGDLNVTISNTDIIDNSANRGGAIEAWTAGVIMNYVRIIGNSAGHCGGIYAEDYSNFYLNNCIISSNSSNGDGGGFDFVSSILTINNSIVDSNSSKDGAGINSWNARVVLQSVIFIDNIATGNGGAINFYSSGQNSSSFNSIKVVKNRAINGGGIYINNGWTPLIINSIIAQNIANNNGGGIYGYINLSKTSIVSNKAFNKGGAVLIAYESNIDKCTIANNITQNIVGGIYIENTYYITNQFSNSNFINNGWGIYNLINSFIAGAISNYWGSNVGPYHPIQNTTGDGDSVNSYVNVTPWLIEPNTEAPPPPVQNLMIQNISDTSILLIWNGSLISDLAGYKIYYDTDKSGYPYSNVIDIINDTSYTIKGLTTGQIYYITVTTYDIDGNESWYSNEVSGTITDIAEEIEIISVYKLTQNYPNPFNPTTTISYSLTNNSLVQLKIFNILGQEVATLVNEEKPIGKYEINFNASNLSSGVYFYKIQTGDFVQTKKMILLK
jgi:hypothetical protein